MTFKNLSGLSRRAVLAGLASGFGAQAFALAPATSERPLPRGAVPVPVVPGSEALVREARLGGKVGYAVIDVKTGEVLEAREGDTLLPPASTLKTVTALYALDRLGPSFRFATEVLVTGPVENGRLNGDLVLKGGGDPTLDTDRLADLAIALREAGLREVTGRFLVWHGDLPAGDRIDDDQPEHVGYNPAFGGLNLNFNRVHFEWKRSGDGYAVTMEARSARFSPATSVAQMDVVDRKAPVYDYWTTRERDIWSVSRGALGQNGARWLPVRYPALYAGDVFRTLARSNGIVLKAPEKVASQPDGRVLVSTESEPLVPVLVDMLKYSTNLTAEMAGILASLSNGVPVNGVLGSGSRMAGWAMERYGVTRVKFRDHSGLGYGSEISPLGMVRILAANSGVRAILKPVDLALGKAEPAPAGVEAKAKTGTLNFVSSLTGFIRTRQGRELCFAIFTADTDRRDAIPPEARERPDGARGWASRSRQLQKELLRAWAAKFDAA